MLTDILAAPQPGPALPTPANVGPVGEWFLPAVIIGISILVDSTAAGPAARRDRFAALGTYAGFLGLISVYGWSDDIQRWIGNSWSWIVAGSAVAFLVHVGLIVVIVGDKAESTKRVGAWIGKKVGFDSKESAAVGKLNTKLHLCAIFAACSYVLARGPAAAVPQAVGEGLTTASGAIGMWVIHAVGG